MKSSLPCQLHVAYLANVLTCPSAPQGDESKSWGPQFIQACKLPSLGLRTGCRIYHVVRWQIYTAVG